MSREIPSLGWLLAFQAIVAHGSVSAAANAIGLTQSAVSRQLAALELFLGIPLFARVKKRLMLTDRGARYLEEIAPLLQGLATASRSAGGAGQQHSTLNLATLPTFGAKWLAPRLGSFCAANPHITVNLVTRPVPFDFAHDQLDGAIHFGSNQWPGATASFLMNEQVAAVAAPELAQSIERAEQVTQLPLLQITSRPFSWREWFEAAGAPSQTYRLSLQVETFAMAIEAATAGLCAAVLPVLFIAGELKIGKLQKLLGITQKSTGAYYFVCPDGKRNWPAVKRFSEWIAGEILK